MFKLVKILLILIISLSNINYATADDEFTDAAIDINSNCPAGATCIDNPIGAQEPNVNIIIGNIIQVVLGIVGSLALAMFIYGGFVLMLSAGNQERVQKGKDVLIWATVGLVVVFTSYAAVAFVIKGFTVNL